MWSARRPPARVSGPAARTNDIDTDERRQTIPQRGRTTTNRRQGGSTNGVSCRDPPDLRLAVIVVSSRSAGGTDSAAAAPCRSRPAISTALLGASAHTRLMAAKPHTPMISIRRWPIRSASRPKVISREASIRP